MTPLLHTTETSPADWQHSSRDRIAIPQLLVSVRTAEELCAAITGGADIIDLKEPSHGALGCLHPDQLAQCLDVHRQTKVPPPLSVAMGELNDWLQPWSHKQQKIMSLIEANQSGIRFLKFGLSDVSESEFVGRWHQLMRALIPSVQGCSDGAGTSAEEASQTSTTQEPHLRKPWIIPAIYADTRNASSPEPEAVLQACTELAIRGILIDTHTKDGRGLRGWMDRDRLILLQAQTRRQGMFLALAGQIDQRHLAEVISIQPDVIGVRGAVCETGDRQSVLSSHLVRSLKVSFRAAKSLP